MGKLKIDKECLFEVENCIVCGRKLNAEGIYTGHVNKWKSYVCHWVKAGFCSKKCCDRYEPMKQADGNYGAWLEQDGLVLHIFYGNILQKLGIKKSVFLEED